MGLSHPTRNPCPIVPRASSKLGTPACCHFPWERFPPPFGIGDLEQERGEGRIILDNPTQQPTLPYRVPINRAPLQPPEGASRPWNETLQIGTPVPQLDLGSGSCCGCASAAAEPAQAAFPRADNPGFTKGPRSALSSPCPARLQRLEIQAAEVSQPVRAGVTVGHTWDGRR